MHARGRRFVCKTYTDEFECEGNWSSPLKCQAHNSHVKCCMTDQIVGYMRYGH